MAENSKIEWTDHTFNPWIGCTKVSPACKLCYAETLMDKRYGRVKWGPGQPRVRTSEANWRKPLAWNREAERARKFWAQCGAVGSPPPRPRVFCASLADWLDDDQVPIGWLADLLALVAVTPDLDWLLLSKRPHLWRSRVEAAVATRSPGLLMADWWLDGEAPANVWVGCTVEDQEHADRRIPELLAIPARVRFLSCEPLLSRIDLAAAAGVTYWDDPSAGIGWVIGGGESGRGARPTHPDHARFLRDQCVEAGIPFFWKQWGAWAPSPESTAFRRAEDAGKLVPYTIASSTSRARGSRPGERTWHATPGDVIADGPGHVDVMREVGKATAGRLLDGRTWDELPEART